MFKLSCVICPLRKKYTLKYPLRETSLVVQWLRLHASNAGGLGSIPVQGTRSHVHAATESSHATTKTRRNQKKNIYISIKKIRKT